MSLDSKQRERNRHWSDSALAYHEKWEKPTAEASLYKELEAQLMLEFTEACEGKKILDLCCGTGRNTLALSRTGAQLWGVDGASGMVRKARENALSQGLDNVTFLLGDARSLPFSDDIFDAVTGTRFMYMMKPQEKKQIINEIRRVLKPGGTVVLQFNVGFWGIKHEIMNLFHGSKPRLRHRYIWPGQVTRLFDGFHVQSVVGVKLPRLAAVSRLLGKKVATSLNRIMRWPGFRFLTAYLLVKATKL